LLRTRRTFAKVAREFLESGGYTVIEARDGTEALKRVEKHDGAIHLLVTDMVMPGMDWAGTFRETAAAPPGNTGSLHVGYSEKAAADSTFGGSAIRLLTKPFSRWALLRAVHEILKTILKLAGVLLTRRNSDEF